MSKQRGAKALAEIAKAMTAKKTAQKSKPNVERPIARTELVNPFAASHGAYDDAIVVDLDGSLGGKRMSMVKVVLNRGGTAVDRWIANDQASIFGESEQRAIRYCQNLWVRADGGVRAVDPTADVVDNVLGWSQQEALVELRRIEARVPQPYWMVYQNVCRFDEEAGRAGSRLASNTRSAIDAAKTTVAFTASLIAMWRRL